MKRPIDETMAEARRFFLERSQTSSNVDERPVSEHLCEMAEAIQENRRMLEMLRSEIGELHHVIGVR